jgi:hypothetical protein
MAERRPKYLVKNGSWMAADARATNTGEWPFTFGLWKMTFYPYLHDTEDDIIWLNPEIEHIHPFVDQRVKLLNKLPEWNAALNMYDVSALLPYCLLCGVFMEDCHYESFQKSKEMVYLAVKKGN